MWRNRMSFCAALGVAGLMVATLNAQSAQPQTSTTTETKKFEILAVDGNHVVVRGEAGNTQELTVPDSYKLTVDGRSIGVSELKPGMKGTATITTTTTVKPVVVTEVKQAKVFRATGSSLIISTPEGYRTISAADASARNATIYKDGQKADFSSLHEGDVLTATIVTNKPPQILTERQVQAALTGAPAAAANAVKATAGAVASGTRAVTGAGSTGAAAATEPARKLPKTASTMPLVLGIGLIALATGFGLTMLRKRQRLVR